MTTLTSEYQFLGRSNAVRAVGSTSSGSAPSIPGEDLPAPPSQGTSNLFYYILLYGKTVADPATGKHRVSVKVRLACSGNSSFYGFLTTASANIAGASAFAWSYKPYPDAYWGDSPALTENGVTYRRWVDLREGTVEVNTGYSESEIDISASFRRNTIDGETPSWLPKTDTAAVSVSALLPSFEPSEPEQPAEHISYDGTRVYADGALVYDSTLEELDLVALKATTGLNVGGTAEITMRGGHPAYNYFTGHKTVVTIYRGDSLRFRGRALYAETDFLRRRKIVCEGELCFLRDAVNRPYNYVNSTPGKVFRALIRAHNEQVDSFKQFEIGTVTVPDSEVSFKSESAETVLATMNKLLDRCGGYIVFTTNANGKRVINYLQSVNRRSKQTIEFGENLLDFSSTGANNGSLATGVIPYGAKDEKTKQRITIESVNGGKDYIIADDARAVRGTIMASAVFEDATTPAALLKAAQDWLAGRKSFITSLELTTLDLSYLDKNLDSFAVGDSIQVLSAPHAVNEVFQLAQMTEDFLNPANSRITLGKDIPSLTGADVAGDFNSQKALESTAEALRQDYSVDVDQIVQQAGEQVMGQVAQTYVPQATLNDSLEQLRTRIGAEEQARAVADAELQIGLNTEKTTRASADTTLQSNIDAEATARATADTNLWSKITDEIARRVEGDNTLQDNIDAEAEARETADTTLSARIEEVNTTRYNADQTILKFASDVRDWAQDKIDALEIKTAKLATADATLQDNIDAEAEARESADTNLWNKITTEIERRTEADTALADRIDIMSTRVDGVQQADTDMLNRVSSLDQAFSDLIIRMNVEENTRRTDDSSLLVSINNEIQARAGMISKSNGTVNIGGGAPINMNGSTIDVTSAQGAFIHTALNFDNGLGIRIKDSEGQSENGYYVVRVDTSDSFIVGSDYFNLYLRGKDAVYLYKTGAAVTSDQREKNSIEELPDAYVDMLDKLTPLRFRYNDKGDRYHVGFVAQDVDRALAESGMDREDFGGFVDLNRDGSHLGLVYDEFIGLLLAKIKKLETRLKVLEEKA